MAEVWAKSNGIRLYQHIEDVLKAFERFKEKVPSELHEIIKLACFYHDFGKVTPAFQLKIGNKGYEPFDISCEVPHSLFSVFWIDEKNLNLEENLKKFLISAVAYHHWRGDFDYFLGNSEEFKRFANKVIEWENLLINNLKTEISFIEDISEEFKNPSLDKRKLLGISRGVKFYHYAVPPYKLDYVPLRELGFNKDWILISGTLQRCDHFASWVEEENESIDKIELKPRDYNFVENNIITGIKIKLKDNVDKLNIWQTKEIENRKDKNLILIAPTGSGKTEFAFLWAAGEKFFYTLPLRAAVNQIFERAKKIFDENNKNNTELLHSDAFDENNKNNTELLHSDAFDENNKNNTGLLHSDADVYLREDFPEGENFRLLDLAKQLSLPVIISTGDQLFPSALKYPGYEKIYATLGYSRLVIDEVQAYDPKACAIIVKLIEDIVKLGGKFLLMTATLPKFIREEIKNRIEKEFPEVDIKEFFEEVDIYNNDKYRDQYDFYKHKIRLYNADIEEKAEEIIEKAKEGKRVLVIVNTVEKAQKMYDTLKAVNKDGIDLKLLHSRFTFADRKRLEDEIVGTEDKKGTFSNPKPDDEKEGKILVATQVIEASLDIDADILYTELAPIDSLIQRMGRVLRRIKDKNGHEKYFTSRQPEKPNVFVFYQIPDKDKNLCSGAGTVYQNDLLILSLGILLGVPEKKISEIWRKYKGNNVGEVVKNLISEYKNKEIPEIPVKEAEKKTLVEKLYTNLPESSNYLKKFYETLDILDAGYMSDKKVEAQNIFREIYTVPAIPENKVEEFKESIETFVNSIKNKKFPFNYTSFKKEVLSNYVVNVDVRKYLYGNNLNLKDASYLAVEIKNIDDRQMSKIKRWLKGIYLVPEKYDKDIGLISEENKPNDN